MTVYYPRCHAHLNVVFDGRGIPDTEPLLVDTVPKAATVYRNGYHEADTFSLEFDARQLPFDPELIRSMAVAIYMFGAEGPDDRREWAVPDYEMILGLADEPNLALSRDGQRFRIEGRDYTALLADTEWDPKNRIPAGRPLDQVVQDIADAAAPPGARMRFKVKFESREVLRPPTVGASRRATKKKGLWVEPGTGYWDVIYRLCLREGFIAFVRGEDIIITDPRTQTAISLESAPRVAYGKDLDTLDVTRRLAKERVPQIECVSRDHRTGQTIRVRYPTRHDSPKTGIGTIKDETQRIVVRGGIRDLATLKRIAKCRYDNMARAESAYRFSTLHLRSLNDVDLLRLDAGTPVYIQWDPFNKEQMRSLNEAQRLEHLLVMGYSPRLSAYLAGHYDRLDQFKQPHYLRGAEFSWSDGEGGGITISGDAVNYAYAPRELRETALS